MLIRLNKIACPEKSDKLDAGIKSADAAVTIDDLIVTIRGGNMTTFNSWKNDKLIPYAELLIRLGKLPCLEKSDTADNQAVTQTFTYKEGDIEVEVPFTE